MTDAAELIRRRFEELDPVLDEQARRRFAAAEANALGRGGVTLVANVTGIARSTINRGRAEIEAKQLAGEGRVRRPGGGRKSKTVEDPTLLRDLQSLLEASTRGDPMSPLLWTSKSLDKLCAALKNLQHSVCPNVVAGLLRGLGYSLQSNRKTREGSRHPDRDAQFQYLDARMKEHIAEQSPVISVDTKKKELVGDFKNGGRELRPKASPEQVRVHDFIDPELGRAVPYGIYDIADNKGWVSVGIDHDTAAFAVNTIRSWWATMGKARYPKAKRLMITADGGGSNGARVRLWKLELQRFVDEVGMPVTVCHLPPGTSKWNKIEHRLFSFITKNWRGKPLVSHQTIVQLIGATTTKKGLSVHAELDRNSYPAGIKVSDAEMAGINIERHDFHGEWNYTLQPRSA
jgi:Rhodopirellula transposase DDE domain